jgi:outer membrane protein OmpA-like peptidoglycan-associated protein
MMSKMTLRWGFLSLLTTLSSEALAQASAPPASPAPGDDPATTAPSAAGAEPASGAASLSFGSDSGAAATTAGSANAEAPSVEPAGNPAPTATPPESAQSDSWFAKYLPVDGMFELGTGLGLLFPSSNHNFRLEDRPQQKIGSATELFVRAAWLPIRFAGVETEWAAGAATTADHAQSYPWAMRFHAIGQVPLWRVTPFVLIGLGRMGNVSNSLGSDGDPLFHFGGGAKVYLSDSVLMRLDLRDNMTQKYASANGTLTHSPELLVGVSLTLGRPTAPAQSAVCPKEDSDGDGIVDAKDKCPAQAGDARDGCPILDSDKDGVADDTDHCVDVPGVAPTGCPADRDADGVNDANDKCPDEKGAPPDGCPTDKDSDNDGIIDSLDKCPKEAENKNGYEDSDGCPDVIPAKIKEFTGIVQGITFDQNRATIRPNSKPTLDKAAALLKEYPALRVAISGHTDNTETRDKNVQLSKERADSVKKYLVEQGITDSRIETRGAGPDEPVDSNATAAGRERNRRIEFKLIAEK